MTEPVKSVLDLAGAYKAREQGGVGFELYVPSFHLRRGEFVAIVGESGCGKSTLLDMLALVLRPTRCERFHLYEPDGYGSPTALDVAALWETGAEVELARVRRNHLGYVLQTGGLLPFLTVEQNIELPIRIKGAAHHKDNLMSLARRMGVQGLLSKKPRFLSGGQRQRVAILRALSHEPILVLADEPTAAVDRTRAEKIVADFRSLAIQDGSTIVMVTHDHGLVADVADRTFTFDVSQVSDTLTRSVCIETTVG